jgi:hypothetical protein
MVADFDAIVRVFEENSKAVDRLLDFPQEIVDVAADCLRTVQPLLTTHNASLMVKNRLTLLENIGTDSLRGQYEAMFNQCVVLLVSYFDSVLRGLFRHSVATALASASAVPAANEELKISWRVVARSEGERESMFADLLIAEHDISFQDMQSVSRAFQKHLDIEIKRIPETNNIIVGQAARHAIVHAGGFVDQRMINQTSGAVPRTLKDSLVLGAAIRFSPEEVRILKDSMMTYVLNVAGLLEASSANWKTQS